MDGDNNDEQMQCELLALASSLNSNAKQNMSDVFADASRIRARMGRAVEDVQRSHAAMVAVVEQLVHLLVDPSHDDVRA